MISGNIGDIGPRGGRLRRWRKTQPLDCKVCGDLASGFHFEVPSCNGCQQFFRRTLLEARRYKCRWNYKCKLEKGTRCACRACRYKKCLDVGMNSSTMRVLPAGPEVVDLTKSTESLALTSNSEANSLDVPSTSSSAPLLKPTPYIPPVSAPAVLEPRFQASWIAVLDEPSYQGILNTLLAIEEKVELLRLCSVHPPALFLDVLTSPSPFSEGMPPLMSLSSKMGAPSINTEVYSLLEYAKCFKWFCVLTFPDKCSLLGERLPALLALRLAWNQSELVQSMPYSLLLAPLIAMVQKIVIDKKSISLLSILLFTDTANIPLSPAAQEEQLRQNNFYASCFSTHLMRRYGAMEAENTAKHYAILSAALNIGQAMKVYLRELEPENSLSKQVVDLVMTRK